MPGAVTVTPTVALVTGIMPVAVTDTVVDPGLIGSNATPPVATVEGDCDCPAAIVTVCDCAAPVELVSCATFPLELFTVTVIGCPSIRTACAGLTNEFVGDPAGTPTRATNGATGVRLVVLAARPPISIAAWTTWTVPVALWNCGDDAVTVASATTFSTP